MLAKASIQFDKAAMYYVYIMTNQPYGTLYIGVTNDLARRTYEHREKLVKGFTARYGLNKLVYYETFEDIREAIAREKAMKVWRREWKKKAIDQFNPEWRDLYPELTP